MKWLIKNPAPAGPNGKQWGDYHFGAALERALAESGEQVQTVFRGRWDQEPEVDVELVLRGRHAETRRSAAFRVLWVISHPEEVSREEWRSYDLVCVASERHAQDLGERLDRPVVPLLQAADTSLFHLEDESNVRARSDIVFVGNTRNQPRESVIWAVEAGLDVKVWGKGWDQWIDPKHVAGPYLPYEQLPAVYRTAKITLNDHWPEMSRLGYINNRIFEALACGLPVISDFQEGLGERFSGAVLTYQNRDQFFACIEQTMLEYPHLLTHARKAAEMIAGEGGFLDRARTLVAQVRRYNRQG